MAQKSIGIIMNGVSGRMGYRQHLVRSILAIREQGGVAARRRHAACRSSRSWSAAARPSSPSSPRKHGIERLHDRPRRGARRPALADLRRLPRDQGARVGDPQGHRRRQGTSTPRSPPPRRFDEALELARLADAAGVKNGVVHDKLYLPGPAEAQAPHRLRLLRPHPLACAASSATGCSRATGSPRSARAGTTAPRTAAASSSTCSRTGTTCSRTCSAGSSPSTPRPSPTSPTRWDENGEPYAATADDAAYGIFELEGGIVAQINSSWTVRVNRDELVEFQVDGTHGSRRRRPVRLQDPARNATPKPVWNPDLADDARLRRRLDRGARQRRVPERLQASSGRSSSATCVEDAPYEFDLLAGARGVLLAEAGLQSQPRGPQGVDAAASVGLSPASSARRPGR